VQTAFYIDNVSSSATFDQGEGEESSLSVTFDIFNRGPNHIAGLFVTTDSWGTWQIVHAQFVSFNDGGENWSASLSVPGPKVQTFEFVVFCDDLGGVDSVPRIWNTNAGSVFQVNPAEL
jgi:hypothetical protein